MPCSSRSSSGSPTSSCSSGLMRLLPPRVVAALSPNLINTHPAYLPEFPGAHGVRDALARRRRRRPARASSSSTTASTAGRSSRRSACPCCRRHRADAARAHQARRAPPAHPGRARHRQRPRRPEGASRHERPQPRPQPLPRARRRADPPRAHLGERQDRSRRARHGPRRRRRRDRLDRLDRVDDRAMPASPSPRSPSVTGFPESLDGRVQDAAPRGARRTARRPAPRVARGRSSPSSASRRSSSSSSTCTRSPQTVASGAAADDVVEQIDIGGPAMVRASAKNHANVAIVVSPERYAEVIAARRGRRHDARPAPGARRARPSRTRPRYDVAVAILDRQRRRARRRRGHGRSRLGRRHRWTLEQSLRYGENSHQAAALYVERERPRHRPGRRSCTARRCRTTTTSTPTPPCAPPTTSPNPPSRSSSTRTRAASPSRHGCRGRHRLGPRARARLRPGVGLRRRHRREPHRHRAMAADASTDIFTEVLVAPGFEPEALELLTAEEEPAPAAAARRLRARPASSSSRSRAACSCSRPTRTSPRSRELDARRRRRGGCRDPRRPRVRLARVPRREVERHPARRRTGHPSASAWARSTGSTPATSRSNRAGERAAGSVAASDAFFPFADGPQILLDAGVTADRAARRLDARRRGHRRGDGGRRDDVLHGRAPLLPLTAVSRERRSSTGGPSTSQEAATSWPSPDAGTARARSTYLEAAHTPRRSPIRPRGDHTRRLDDDSHHTAATSHPITTDRSHATAPDFDHERVLVVTGRRSGLTIIVAVHSTAPRPGPRRMPSLAVRRLAGRPGRRAPAVGRDDPQERGRRPAPGRRQGRHLHSARNRADRRRARTPRCSTSATPSRASTAAT